MSGYAGLSISKYVVAAMCGCWCRESGVNPAIWESLIPCAWDYEYQYTNRGGYGLGQWTNVGTPHGRLYRLHQWVTNNGYGDGNGYGQLEYVLAENVWYDKPESRLGCHSLTQFLECTSTNVHDLVWDFLANWEGVTGNAYTLRCQYADDILRYIDAHVNDGQSYSWITGNRYLSFAQTCNNAMVVFQYIGGTPSSGQYHVYCSSTGNGNCYAVPTSHDALSGETFTVYAQPYDSDVLEDLVAKDAQGHYVAVSVSEEHIYDATLFPYDIWFEATFSGETPPSPPPTPENPRRKRMPVWMYPLFKNKRRILW